ncbi:multicopper oxidase family protein [Gloeothece verrucosa]|uniref:Multicopper oxidase type 3 n=1 Tax=Gloeothece verrucosa (strain PCC 7822) TaxID=497965 RepID=E0U971_GLOV7|nr:multicopper oxidase family protein [Gloeothece verrucosa]ADN17329.1 multicopper oxidase type 3 [Gloeothece verrucosa PCC 7822]
MKRRQFLLVSAASMMATTATSWAISKNQRGALPNSSPTPKLIQSRDGLLELNLEASLSPLNFNAQQAYLMSYNRQLPAPRLEAKAGDTVRIHLTNHLQQPTNLHYHGLHVIPTGTGDNPFLSIPPQEQFTYEFTIPQNHPSGIFSYHPHHHHLVAEQVFNGLIGLFIVRGEFDTIPEIEAAKEEFLVFQDFALDAGGHIQNTNQMDLMRGREGNLLTVNGQIQPDLKIARGGLLRLRLLNASASRFYRLSLENHPFYLIATDGRSLSEPVESEELLLAPGERAEVLVKGEQEPGHYRLLNLPYDRGGMSMMGGGMGMMGGHHSMVNTNQSMPQVLATFTYQGTSNPLPLPTKLMPVESLATPKKVRKIELSMTMSMGMGMNMAFLFNGQEFDPNRIDAEVKLNSIEDWELINVDPDGMAHPFHLHINPFQVISRNGQPEPYRAWKDTIVVRGDEMVTIRIPFRDFTGKTVYHCHILDHEDLGMMGIVNITA